MCSLLYARFETELIVQEVEGGNDDSYFTGIEATNSSIRVPTELVRMMGNGPVTVASVYYRNMSGLLPGTLPGERDTVLASPVISTSLQCGDKICDTANIQLSQPVIVTLKHSSQLVQVSWYLASVREGVSPSPWITGEAFVVKTHHS